MTYQARRVVLLLAVVCLLAMIPARNVSAQTASCTGNQTNTDINNDQCQSISNGGGTATANATGPIPSDANAEADGSTSSATSSAFNGSTADSFAEDSSAADASANEDGFSYAQATGRGTADAGATEDSISEAFAAESGFGYALADDDSVAAAGAAGDAFAFALADGGSEAIAADSIPGSVSCAYAINGAFAQAGDSEAPVCDPGPSGIAVVVSPLGSCGPVAMSPCATIPRNDALVRLVNPNGGPAGLFSTEEHPVCAMIYVFDDDQEMQACCGCPISSAGMLTLSSNRDLRANVIGENSVDPNLGWVDVVAAAENATLGSGSSSDNGRGCPTGQSGACNGGCDPTSNPGYNVDPGDTLLGSVSRSQFISSNNPYNPTLGVTETPLPINRPRDSRNLNYLQAECGALVGNGSGAGTCHCPEEGIPR